jgi:hypothetical protein
MTVLNNYSYRGKIMKKSILALLLLSLSSSCFALFTPTLPQQIVCDATNFCLAQDDRFAISGWTLQLENGTHIKPGIYKFEQASFEGDPNDNFIKSVAFSYAMIDAHGYRYELQYQAYNWIVPEHKENYTCGSYGCECKFPNISDCYVNIQAPQTH